MSLSLLVAFLFLSLRSASPTSLKMPLRMHRTQTSWRISHPKPNLLARQRTTDVLAQLSLSKASARVKTVSAATKRATWNVSHKFEGAAEGSVGSILGIGLPYFVAATGEVEGEREDWEEGRLASI